MENSRILDHGQEGGYPVVLKCLKLESALDGIVILPKVPSLHQCIRTNTCTAQAPAP